jgi:hypothetical protein
MSAMDPEDSMHNGMAISINYWAAQKGSLDLDDLTGINDFRDELERSM